MFYVRQVDIIKIIPCVVGDRSDCEPKASSIAQSQRQNMALSFTGCPKKFDRIITPFLDTFTCYAGY